MTTSAWICRYESQMVSFLLRNCFCPKYPTKCGAEMICALVEHRTLLTDQGGSFEKGPAGRTSQVQKLFLFHWRCWPVSSLFAKQAHCHLVSLRSTAQVTCFWTNLRQISDKSIMQGRSFAGTWDIIENSTGMNRLPFDLPPYTYVFGNKAQEGKGMLFKQKWPICYISANDHRKKTKKRGISISTFNLQIKEQRDMTC